ncbi:RNA-splicing factor, partial [Xylographa bjoerkii]|nr:RNA-splicing factor [Xylographa bjoerkii]
VDEDEIEAQTAALRQKLAAARDGAKTSGRGLKAHQVHELAAAKIEESERLRKALGIREDYEEGGHWKKQEERLREGVGEGRREGGR